MVLPFECSSLCFVLCFFLDSLLRNVGGPAVEPPSGLFGAYLLRRLEAFAVCSPSPAVLRLWHAPRTSLRGLRVFRLPSFTLLALLSAVLGFPPPFLHSPRGVPRVFHLPLFALLHMTNEVNRLSSSSASATVPARCALDRHWL